MNLWDDVLARVEEKVNRHSFATWFRPTTFETLRGNALHVRVPNAHFKEAKKFEERGSHRQLYRFSLNDYKEVAAVWTGTHPEDGKPLEVIDGPPEGGNLADLQGIASAFAPEYTGEEIFEIATKLYNKAK